MSILFTGQYRDTELASSALSSGLDYFMARHMAPGLGRFLQPDPAGNLVAEPGSPQSWHLYNYVWNNPFAYVDPTGLDVEQFGNCYWNTSTDPETGQTIYLEGPVCFLQGTGGGSDSSTPSVEPAKRENPKPPANNGTSKLVAPGGHYTVGPNGCPLPTSDGETLSLTDLMRSIQCASRQ